MSGFEYYAFQIVDKPLSSVEIQAVRQLSSRARVNSTRAQFVYNFGSFKGNSTEVLRLYFDAMLYVSNFGTKQLCFKLPLALVDVPALQVYETEYIVDIEVGKEFIIVDMSLDDEEGGGEWIEEEDVDSLLAELLPIRRALMLGDYRALFLACMANFKDEDPRLISLPVPPNLQNLDSSLIVFSKFFELSQSDIDAQAVRSPVVETELSPVQAISELSREEMGRFLEGFLYSEPCVDVEFIKALQKKVAGKQ